MTPDRNDFYRALVIGRGEVGKAISKIFNCPAIDINEVHRGEVQYMHICFGWSDGFEDAVLLYQKRYRPMYTIIHSTVPIGTSSRLKSVHSPIRGMHPNLEEGIRAHTKFLGGKDAGSVAEYFRDFGLRVMLCDKSEATELGMLLGTECYRINIEFAKHAKELCDRHGVCFNESYTLFAKEYNDGWIRLGRPEYIRQILTPIPGKIGGHCLENNKELIKK